MTDVRAVAQTLWSIATVERHDEQIVPFERLKPSLSDEGLIQTDMVFLKHRYLQPCRLISYLQGRTLDRVLVCGMQADTCVLAVGFALFDAGLRPSLRS